MVGCTFSKTERFSLLGLHPKLDKLGLYQRKKIRLGPGQYTAISVDTCKKKITSLWKRQEDSQYFSKNLGNRNPDVLAYRSFMSKHLGPGSHEIPIDYYEKSSSSVSRNKGFGMQERFFGFSQDTPPCSMYKCKDKRRKPEWFFNRAPRFLERKTCSVPPNVYKIKGGPGSIDGLIQKVVSKRGPYDLFTGPRTESNVFNKFKRIEGQSPDKYYNIGSLFENSSKNGSRGKFLRACRFPATPTVRMMLNDLSLCYRDPSAPGPASYSINNYTIKPKPESPFPFSVTGLIVRPDTTYKFRPGPGRYTPKPPKCPMSHKGTSVFKSKTGRTQHKVQVYNSF